MKKSISPYVEFNGVSIRLKSFFEIAGQTANYSIKRVPFKLDLRYWNDSPWSMQPDGAIHVKIRDGRDSYRDGGVYQFWSRKDGMGIEVEYFESFNDYEEYSPSGESPLAIKKEIGLCENYASGI